MQMCLINITRYVMDIEWTMRLGAISGLDAGGWFRLRDWQLAKRACYTANRLSGGIVVSLFYSSNSAQIHCSCMFSANNSSILKPDYYSDFNNDNKIIKLTRLIRYIGSRHLNRCGTSGNVEEDVFVMIVNNNKKYLNMGKLILIKVEIY